MDPDAIVVWKSKEDFYQHHRVELLVEFVILGMMSEYMGKRIKEATDEIEEFYPAEEQLAAIFESLIRRLQQKYDLAGRVERRVGPQGHITVVLEAAAMLIHSFYEPNFDKGGRIRYSDGGVVRYDTCGIDEKRFEYLMFNATELEYRAAALSFLLGAYWRYGEKGIYRIANATHKVELIRHLLFSVGCEYVAWKMFRHGAPIVHELEFIPTLTLRKLLRLPPSAGSE